MLPKLNRDIPYTEVSRVNWGRLKPIHNLQAAINFGFLIPVMIIMNGPLIAAQGVAALLIVGITVCTIIVVASLRAYNHSKLIYVDVESPIRGHAGFAAKESPEFGINEAQKVADFIRGRITNDH